MIDCENEVYTMIYNKLNDEYPGISVSGAYNNVPASFPHVSVTQNDNYNLQSVMGSGNYEVAIVMYEINVYTSGERKKDTCKKIMATIDNLLLAHNFSRISLAPVPNMADNNIYRLVGRYQVATDGTNFYSNRR